MHIKQRFLQHIRCCFYFIEGMINFINKNMPSKKSLQLVSIQLIVKLRKTFSSTLRALNNDCLRVSSCYFIEGIATFINTTYTKEEIISCVQLLVQLKKHSFHQHRCTKKIINAMYPSSLPLKKELFS